mmetsp:Transcript_59716/g.98560  ORF Transcript_59716/g.98560 Transcript_59716/m.98560 type:complete len:1479 (-) Transcript_59716:93-4529(-)
MISNLPLHALLCLIVIGVDGVDHDIYDYTSYFTLNRYRFSYDDLVRRHNGDALINDSHVLLQSVNASTLHFRVNHDIDIDFDRDADFHSISYRYDYAASSALSIQASQASQQRRLLLLPRKHRSNGNLPGAGPGTDAEKDEGPGTDSYRAGNWKLILRLKDVKKGFFASPLRETGLENDHDEDANTFSIIGRLTRPQRYKSPIDHKFYFKIVYRNEDGTKTPLVWAQTSWLTESEIEGYEAVEVPSQDSNNVCTQFAGLGRSTAPQTYLDSHPSLTCWHNAIGPTEAWNDGIPAFNGKKAVGEELYVFRYPGSYAHGRMHRIRERKHKKREHVVRGNAVGEKAELYTFEEAKEFCKYHYGGMVSIANADKNNEVTQLCEQLGGKCWIGLQAPSAGCTECWSEVKQWVDGASYGDYRNWFPGEPDKVDANQKCTEIYENGQWSDVRCDLERHVICDKPEIVQFDDLYVVGKKDTFPDALEWCKANYGDKAGLAKIAGFEQNENVRSGCSALQPGADDIECWIGLKPDDTHKFDRWQDLSTVAYKQWLSSEPRSDVGYDCAAMRVGLDTFGWHSKLCSDEAYFVCDKNAEAGLVKTKVKTSSTEQSSSGPSRVLQQTPKYKPKTEPKYLGCYADTGSRALRYGPHQYGFTPDTCSKACKEHKYFALQHNGWCCCDDELAHVTKYGLSTNCPANRMGGGWANDVFENGENPYDLNEQSDERYIWRGCYKDTGSHALRHGPHAWHYNAKTCSVACKDFKYFALQAGSWCSCEDSWKHATKYHGATSCPANHVGAGWANDIYENIKSDEDVMHQKIQQVAQEQQQNFQKQQQEQTQNLKQHFQENMNEVQEKHGERLQNLQQNFKENMNEWQQKQGQQMQTMQSQLGAWHEKHSQNVNEMREALVQEMQKGFAKNNEKNNEQSVLLGRIDDIKRQQTELEFRHKLFEQAKQQKHALKQQSNTIKEEQLEWEKKQEVMRQQRMEEKQKMMEQRHAMRVHEHNQLLNGLKGFLLAFKNLDQEQIQNQKKLIMNEEEEKKEKEEREKEERKKEERSREKEEKQTRLEKLLRAVGTGTQSLLNRHRHRYAYRNGMGVMRGVRDMGGMRGMRGMRGMGGMRGMNGMPHNVQLETQFSNVGHPRYNAPPPLAPPPLMPPIPPMPPNNKETGSDATIRLLRKLHNEHNVPFQSKVQFGASAISNPLHHDSEFKHEVSMIQAPARRRLRLSDDMQETTDDETQFMFVELRKCMFDARFEVCVTHNIQQKEVSFEMYSLQRQQLKSDKYHRGRAQATPPEPLLQSDEFVFYAPMGVMHTFDAWRYGLMMRGRDEKSRLEPHAFDAYTHHFVTYSYELELGKNSDSDGGGDDANSQCVQHQANQLQPIPFDICIRDSDAMNNPVLYFENVRFYEEFGDEYLTTSMRLVQMLELFYLNDEQWNEIIVDKNGYLQKCTSVEIGNICFTAYEQQRYKIELELQLIHQARDQTVPNL